MGDFFSALAVKLPFFLVLASLHTVAGMKIPTPPKKGIAALLNSWRNIAGNQIKYLSLAMIN